MIVRTLKRLCTQLALFSAFMSFILGSFVIAGSLNLETTVISVFLIQDFKILRQCG